MILTFRDVLGIACAVALGHTLYDLLALLPRLFDSLMGTNPNDQPTVREDK